MATRRTRTPSRASSQTTTLRHVWLAGLGVVAVSGREALAAPARLAERAGEWQAVARRLADDVRSRVRDEVRPRVADLGAQVEARLAPVLERFGLIESHHVTRKASRKAHRPRGRRATAPPAKRATRRR